MLEIFESLPQLDMRRLMDLYAEGNQENGRVFYPHLSPEEAVARAEADFESYLREDFFRQKGAFYCVWSLDGIYMSALRLEPYEDGMLLEALETHPVHRRRGYAKTLLRQVQSLLAQRGTGTVYSHVGKKNEPSLRTHFSCGFSIAADHARYVDGTVTNRSYTLRWKV